MLEHANSFRDLIVYQKTQRVATEIFILTKVFPKEEMYSLTDQVRRSSRSVGAQIAEAWAKRRYIRHFISKLTDSDGEQLETQHWIDTACNCGYLNETKVKELNNELKQIGKMLNSMILKANTFCGNEFVVNEECVEYFADN
jgi:four helix bundle protein